MDLSTSIKKIPNVGKKYQKRLNKLGIKNVRDLLYHFPHRYEDFSEITKIAEISPNKTVCVKGEIKEIENKRTWKKKMILTQAIVQDKTAPLKVIWFNRPYLKKTLKTGTTVCLAGKIKLGKEGLYLNNPIYEKISKSSSNTTSENKFNKEIKSKLIHTGRIIPVYPETEGLSSRWLRYILKPLLFKFRNKIQDPLPEKMRRKYNLLPIKEALIQIHFPDSLKKAKRAKKRFGFEELFLIQISVLKEKLRLKKKKAVSCPMDTELMKDFTESLSFSLTDSQKKAAWQILKDLEKPTPMSRLLEGDVGSGKTVVATMAALNVARNRHQVAFMAPTEILAKQHFRKVRRILDDFKLKIGFLTGKQDKVNAKKLKNEVLEISRRRLLKKLKEGEIDILIGTHALIQEKVKFKDLALVIVDEQHRFGVEQRAKLCLQKEFIPHFLSMTATPIPRTLALTVYGNLDLSLITELPKGRKKVKTKIVSSNKRKQTYNFIKKEIEKGRGVFVICPRIEPTEKEEDKTGWGEVKAVKEEYQKLSEEIFPDLKIGMLHGKMGTREKEKTMKKFKKGEIDILVATSVVEVGIDIPRATVMMIEGAERFGLAQLHQFRGRVGRAKYQSYCFLFTNSRTKKTRKRLKALEKSEDGFELAEKDLEIRGPGELYGNRQWGIPDLAMTSLKDIELVEKTRESAKEILTEDPKLKKYPALKKRVKQFEKKIHFE